MGYICAISLFGLSILAVIAGTVQSLGLRGYCHLCEQIRGDGWCHFQVSTATCAVTVNKGELQFHKQALNAQKQGLGVSDGFNCEIAFKSSIRDQLLKLRGCVIFKDNQFYYNGTMRITHTGLPCQRWDSQSPHQHDFTEDVKTGERLSELNNYCREVENIPARMPWCYTTSENTRWQFCLIEACPLLDFPPINDCYEVREKDGEDYIFYNGTRDTTVSGWTCQMWDEQEPHEHDFGADVSQFYTGENELWEVANYCRVTSEGWGTQLPWCYTTNPDVRMLTVSLADKLFKHIFLRIMLVSVKEYDSASYNLRA